MVRGNGEHSRTKTIQMLSKLDKKIISLISCDLPLVKKPFQELARRAGIKERVLLFRMKTLRENGLMRKFSAVVNHRKLGFKHNAMVVWNIPGRLIHKAGNLMAAYPQVSHCYQRRKAPGWNYNLYSMIHAKSEQECFGVVRSISRKTACKDYKVIFSSKEYKKTPVEY